MASPAEFIANFHSLEGITIGERRKNFFKLLKQNESLQSNPESLQAIITNLEPRNYLETIFKTELLIFFRQSAALLKLLQEGNAVIVSKVLHQEWFIRSIINGIAPNVLVNDILPTMSYRLRMKVMTRLSHLSTDQFDGIFDAFAERYGVYLARKFVVGCSPAKIRLVLSEKVIELTPVQLGRMYEKDATLVDFYFSKKVVHFPSFEHLLKRIYNENQPLYEQLKKSYGFEMHFGYRTTKKVVDLKRGKIIAKPDDFLNILNMKAVVRKLGKDTVLLYRNLLPSDLKNLHWSSIYREFISSKYKYSLFVKITEQHYNIKFSDHPVLITPELLNIIPVEERSILAQAKIDSGEERYIKYLPCEKSIPILKEKISVSADATQRKSWLVDLVKTCWLNKNFNALVSVVKYFLFRHKSEESFVYSDFISTITNTFGFSQFNEEMWQIFHDLLTLQKVKYDRDFPVHTRLSYLKFLFDRGDNIDHLIADFISKPENWKIEWGAYGEKLELCIFNAMLGLNQLEDSQKLYLIQEIDRFNRIHNTNLNLFAFPLLTEHFATLTVAQYPPSEVVSRVKREIRDKTELREPFLTLYFNQIDKYVNVSELKYFLIHDPVVLLSHFDQSVSFLIQKGFDLVYIIKKMSHLGLDQRIIEHCRAKLEADSDEKEDNFVKFLSVLLLPLDYAQLSEKYKPSTAKLDLTDENALKWYHVQCAFGTCFKFTQSHDMAVFGAFLPFCAGDYLRTSLCSLYSIFYRTPENILGAYYNYFLINKAVSVRKHFVALAAELSPLDFYQEALKKASEDMPKLNNVIISSAMRNFVKNPSDKMYELMTSKLSDLNQNDEQGLTLIINSIQDFPAKYRAGFIEFFWNHLETIIENQGKLTGHKLDLLRSMRDDCIKDFRLEFIVKIIESHFFKPISQKIHSAQSLANEIQDFTFKAFSTHAQSVEIIRKVLEIIQAQSDLSKVQSLFGKWQWNMISNKFDSNFLTMYISYWEKKLSPSEKFFSEYVALFFMRSKLQFTKFTGDEFIAHLAKFIGETIDKFSPYVVNYLTVALKECFPALYNSKDAEYKMYARLITTHPSPAVCKIVLELVETIYYYSTDIGYVPRKKSIKKIINYVKDNVTDPGVRVTLYSKFFNFV